MNTWNGLDFFIFLILALNTIRGMSRGAGKEIIALMCLSAALIFAIKFTVPLANFLYSSPIAISVIENKLIINFLHSIGAGPLTLGLLRHIMYSISLLICFVGVFSVTEACIAYSGYTESYSLSQAVFNRKIGGAIGFTRGYVISLLFLSIVTLHIFKDEHRVPGGDFISGSFFVNLFESQTRKLDEMIDSQRPENYQDLYKNKPYSEHDIIKHLSVPEESEQKTY